MGGLPDGRRVQLHQFAQGAQAGRRVEPRGPQVFERGEVRVFFTNAVGRLGHASLRAERAAGEGAGQGTGQGTGQPVRDLAPGAGLAVTSL